MSIHDDLSPSDREAILAHYADLHNAGEAVATDPKTLGQLLDQVTPATLTEPLRSLAFEAFAEARRYQAPAPYLLRLLTVGPEVTA